ncbi:MAG: hypothetical protein ABI461_22700, partial [Polyangiaceae bacterium]
MRFRTAFIVVAASSTVAVASCGGAQVATTGAKDRASSDGSRARADASVNDDAWLTISGNHIVTKSGKPFHGRGANLHDPRSCDGCTYLPIDIAEVERRGDELVDNWKATLVRFDLEAYASSAYPKGDQRVAGQWKSIIDDPAYFTAIQTIVHHLTAKGAYVLV